MATRTVRLDEEVIKQLDKMKVVPDETYSSVVRRLMTMATATITAYMSASTTTYVFHMVR